MRTDANANADNYTYDTDPYTNGYFYGDTKCYANRDTDATTTPPHA